MSNTSESRQAAASPQGVKRPRRPRPRRWLRRLFVLTCLLLAVLIVLVLLAPTALSTDAGRRFVLAKVNDGIAGSVGADDWALGWFSGQQVTGLTVHGVDRAEVLRVGRVGFADASLWSILTGGLSLGSLEVESVTADIIGYDDGTTNLQRALSMRGAPGTSRTPATPPSPGTPGTGGRGRSAPGRGGPAAPTFTWPSGLSFGLELRDIDVAYRAHDAEPIRLSIPKASLSAADPKHLELTLAAELSQAQRKGEIKADARVDQLFDSAGVYQLDRATAQINAGVKDLPIDLLDELTGQDGKLLALVGPIVNGSVEADITSAGGSAAIEAVGENLNINGKLAFDPSGITNIGTPTIDLTLTPHAWSLLTASDDKPASVLEQPVKIAAKLHGLKLPFTEDQLDLANAGLDLELTVGDAQMRIQDVGEVTLASTTGGVSTTRLGELLTASFNTTSSINRRPGDVKLSIELADLIGPDQKVDTQGLSAKINGELTNAPVAAVLDELLPGLTHGLATRTLGPVVEGNIVADVSPRADGKGRTGKFEIDLLTTGGEAGMQSTLIGKFDQDQQALNADLYDGSFIKFTATPGLVSAYLQAFAKPDDDGKQPNPAAVTLGGPATFRLDLTQARARLNKPEDTTLDDQGYALDPASVRLVGKLTSDKVLLNQNGKRAATLEGMLLDVSTAGLTDETTLVLKADIDYPTPDGGEPKPGKVNSTTTVTGLVNAQGEVDPSTASYKTDTHIRRAPIDLIDALFDVQGELVGAVGPRAKLDATGSYQPALDDGSGGIDLVLKSRTADVDAKLLLEKGRWTLKADAPLSFQVTPRLSQTALKKVMPFLGNAVSARLPIGVTVMKEGFSAPQRDFEVNQLNADINLELGELDLRGEGQLKALLTALGVGDGRLFKATFTPVTINIAGGKLSYTGLSMTVDNLVLDFSGEVDLETNRLDLLMVIPSASISVPLTGTIDKPKIDLVGLGFELLKSELGRKTGQELGGTTGDAVSEKIGGEAGEIVGGLLDELLRGDKPEPGADEDQAQDPENKQAADRPLTDEERQARRERRRKRRERLEREQAEREAQQQQP